MAALLNTLLVNLRQLFLAFDGAFQLLVLLLHLQHPTHKCLYLLHSTVTHLYQLGLASFELLLLLLTLSFELLQLSLERVIARRLVGTPPR